MNTVTLTGRLTSDPDTNITGQTEQVTVTKFDLAVDRGGREGTDFIPVTVFGTQAETTAEHLGRGHLVAITGRLHQSKWTTDDGQHRQALEVIAHQATSSPAPATNPPRPGPQPEPRP